jgi:hypothetical protein
MMLIYHIVDTNYHHYKSRIFRFYRYCLTDPSSLTAEVPIFTMSLIRLKSKEFIGKIVISLYSLSKSDRL